MGHNDIISSKPETIVDKRKAYMDIIGNMARGNDEINFTTNNNPFIPTPVNITAEGSSLPPGEVSLDQIMGLGLKK